MNFAFVILHYLCPDMTRKAVDSLLRLDGAQAIEIVLVDNASPDGSGAALEKEYASDTRITVLRLKENLGFAGGNNAGYAFLREKGKADFIIVMNNDVVVEQSDFIRKVEETYLRTPFAVLGPDIFSVKAGIHQNPAHESVFTLEEVRALKSRLEGKNRCFFYRWWTFRLKCLLGLSRMEPPHDSPMWDTPCTGAVLHGACYIFSRDFIMARPFAFNPATFLYMEEDILAKECQDAGLQMMYSPELKVLHHEDVSTDAAFGSACRKARMKNRRMLQSCLILEGLYEG